LIYNFRYIIPQQIIDKYQIFNIHPGNLTTNRGGHPISWSILLGDKSTCLSLHKINEHIDLGLLISTYEVDILESDGFIELEKKLNGGLDYILCDLYDYLLGKICGKNITEGKYNPKIQKKDIIIDVDRDSFEKINRKIRSQSAYNGAVLPIKNYEFYVKGIKEIN
jgi:methionyl-tRNA formyltransferase